MGHYGRIRSAHLGPRTTPGHGEGWGGPDTSEAVTPKRYWARLRADIDRPLRRGAWYHVKKLGPREALLDVLGEADRKSTRLNSSHSQISYAVFCLKKKNHKETPELREDQTA